MITFSDTVYPTLTRILDTALNVLDVTPAVLPGADADLGLAPL